MSIDHSDNIAFLLTQLGTYAATRFAEQMATVELTPPHAGILRAIGAQPGLSQQSLSTQLNLLPSRVVSYVDDLEDRGYVERRRNPDDRRLHALYLSTAGKKMLRRVGELARRHDERMTTGLDAAQRENLRALLQTLADQQDLTPHVHPGFRNLGRAGAGPVKPAG
ncbi:MULTISPECIES: MarR family winged helix-turn-helix transcriptional regulator [unclassified Mycolicibacterium]|uniref:MarR family winged helix-turn-helix transcriptional regulator n=1 Tax=unclassified Mycolicibacterium TaxID=2636767 RepID=UPI001308E552|nr:MULTISPECIES: MarR family winged helix-turn-helix transcriptional regulator [unclassified Mycolicibacterium]MUL83615.1 winged helix-turn-helix transcriptional regulator [Mycolicibacterium sp. CBMA 329]MUL90606.1 winged helix-turn-helix transcriptional regulator [Mycolicibacterium sp. CBMA 331]MUM00576.1 winged helix-turn-helix transcriptional regulator [Mycolicibacterium sp. CBMA 334]MUM25467.1 winged helix-turn-helix transcriptional regulator [Mycolicibacterium sp. CBMA 295]MUM41550.1 wing